MTDKSERRQYARYRIQLPALYKPKGPPPGPIGVGWTRDLSEGGACLEVAEPLSLPLPLTVVLQTNRGRIEVEGAGVWSREAAPGGILHGVAFLEIAPDQCCVLRDLLLADGERRLIGVRLPLDLAVICQPKGPGGPPLPGLTGNASRGGLLLFLPEALAPCTVLDVTLHTTSGGALKAGGTVAWVEPAERRIPGHLIRHGLRFTVLGWSTSVSLGLILVEEGP